MPKLEVFAIQLVNQGAVYSVGEHVSGQVIVTLNEGMKLRNIKLDFLGHAYLHWSESHSRGSGKDRRTVTVHYSNAETYFNQSVILYTPDPFADGKMPPGSYTFPFNFQLPASLPCSFEAGIGYIRYQLKANIDRPWKFDHTTKRPFTVLGMADLNLMPNVRSAIENEDMKTLCCLCCASGPIMARVRLDRTGYVPGEALRVTGEINNRSSRQMDSSRIVLEMVTVYRATTKMRSLKKQIFSVKRGVVLAGRVENFTEVVHIPPLPPSHLPGCRIMDVFYYIKLVVDPSGPSMDLDVPVEIIIGTIPLREIQSAFSPSYFDPTIWGSHVDNEGVATLLPSAPPSNQDIVSTAPPPSYAECVFGKADVRDENDTEHTRGDLHWAPVYTYYSMANQGPAPAYNPQPPPSGPAPYPSAQQGPPGPAPYPSDYQGPSGPAPYPSDYQGPPGPAFNQGPAPYPSDYKGY